MTAPLDAVAVATPAAAERVVCDHEDRCGGCPLIALSYAAQLGVKQERLGKALGRYRPLESVVPSPIAGAEAFVRYRTRAKLMVGPEGSVGLFAQGGGHDIIDIPRCLVLAPCLARVSAYLREHIVSCARTGGALAPFDPAHKSSGGLRALDLREVRADEVSAVLVTLVIEKSGAMDLAPLRAAAEALMRAVPEVIGVAANVHAGDTPQVLGSETLPLAGVTAAPDRVGPAVHWATFGSFVQAHRAQASRVHSLLAEWFGRGGGPKARVLDLYGGSGAIALGLAKAGASVRMVESFAPAIAQAVAAARTQGLHLEAECADVAGALRAMAERHEHFDAAVVNPPRRGTSPHAREWLARLRPSQIAYVSCDPETLARDLDHLARLGYRTASLRPFDMIPLTDQLETVALLRPGDAPLPRALWEHADALAVEKAPHEPTVPQGEYVSSLLARVRRLPQAHEAVPVHRADVAASGIVLFARRPNQLATWSRVLSAPTTRRIYVAAVRGITSAKGAIAHDLRDDGKAIPAVTRYRRIAIASGQSILRIVLGDERRHQIRRHLAAIGHPVLGDDRYGHRPTNRYFEEKNSLDRMFLHCVRLEFDDPDTQVRQAIDAPLAGDLRAVLERMGGPALPSA